MGILVIVMKCESVLSLLKICLSPPQHERPLSLQSDREDLDRAQIKEVTRTHRKTQQCFKDSSRRLIHERTKWTGTCCIMKELKNEAFSAKRVYLVQFNESDAFSKNRWMHKCWLNLESYWKWLFIF